MEDLKGSNTTPTEESLNYPEANNDPGDPLAPSHDEEDGAKTPPLSASHRDMDVENDDDDTVARDATEKNRDDDSDNSDDALSEVDEAQFEDFDPEAIAIEERRIVDTGDVAQIGKFKRKRAEGEERPKKKRKEERRKLKRGKDRDGVEGAVDGDVEGGRRKSRHEKEVVQRVRRARTPSEERDENLTPEERRRKDFSRQLDRALSKPKAARRKATGIDLDAAADDELHDMRKRMSAAAQADTIAREAGKPAMHKLQMLPDVIALLGRNTLQSALVDPDINILESVRYFLEPLNDGSLPAYNIQRELFSALSRLPISKESLSASGIGKVTHFYTRTNKAEAGIKRQAEKLIGEWTRPILKRSDDYSKREMVEAEYDAVKAAQRDISIAVAAAGPGGQEEVRREKAAAARKAALAIPLNGNRARMDGGVGTYSIVPKSDVSSQTQSNGVRRLGASGDEVFRRLKARAGGR